MTREGYLKYKELIEAWANGAEIEVFTNGKWRDCIADLRWCEDIEYRIKPKQTIAEWLEENNGGYVPNWEDENEEKYYIVVCRSGAIVLDFDVYCKKYGTVYMPKDTALTLVYLLNKGEVIEG